MTIPFHLGRLFVIGLSLASLIALSQIAFAQTGTFLDRQLATDLRVVSYNIWLDSVFPDTNTAQAAKFARVVNALDADIWHLQEIYDHSVPQTAALFASITGENWYVHKSFDNITVSRYPLTMLAVIGNPNPPSTSYAISLVDLPNEQFGTDFYFMNSHFKCCNNEGWEEERRQLQADALVSWMRDARNPGGSVTLDDETPMAVVGDLNIVGTQQPLNTLITGNIINNGTYGADSPPDWDGSSLTDPLPLHNVTGTDSYTYRSGSTRSRLDYVLYTDSVADVGHKFILNTQAMTSSQLTATGLQSLDVMVTTSNWDHLPVVIDFRLPEPIIAGDYDDSGYVDMDDFDYWKNAYGTSDPAADGNEDGRVNAADFTIWRDNLGSGDPPGFAAAASIPEPNALVMALGLLGLFMSASLSRDA